MLNAEYFHTVIMIKYTAPLIKSKREILQGTECIKRVKTHPCLSYSMETAPDAHHFITFIRTHFSPIVHHSRNSEVHPQKHFTDVAIRCVINALNAAILMSSHLQGEINKDVLCLKKRQLVRRLQMGFSANCYTVHAASEQTAQLISQLSAVFSALCIMSF